MKNQAALYTITCVSCGAHWSEAETCTTCLKCGNALDVQMDLHSIARNLNRFAMEHTPLSAAKYLDFYPIRDRSKVVTLSEGNTPLYPTRKIGEKYGLPKLYVKNEGANPTGVFKDRGSLVEITKALELKSNAICVASTGNMAASVAAYASQAGLPCYILVPEGTPIGKLSQTLSYGGKLIQIRGTYADCVVLSEELAKRNGYYLAGDYAFRAEGAKSTAFEIVEQLHWEVPDFVIVPVGCGTNISGIWKGFWELHQLGLIERLPQMIAVQPEGCDTVCTAYHQGAERYTKVERPKTVASAVGIGVPQDDIKCLKALRESKGFAFTASDEKILGAQRLLSESESIFTEPSGAIPIAVLPELIEKGVISPLQTVVCIATGTGLKDPKAAILSFSEPPSIDPDISQIEHFLETGTPSLKNEAGPNRQKILFTTLPKKAELQQTIADEFEYQTDELLIENIYQEAESFLRRGKEIGKADLLSILEEAIENTSIPESPLKLIDFQSQDSLQSSPQGKVQIEFNGELVEAEAEGVGPVDALLTALKLSIRKKTDFWPELHDFQVTVVSSRENALVKVRMEMRDRHDNQVTAKASSPDILLASLTAFIKGFNLLYGKK